MNLLTSPYLTLAKYAVIAAAFVAFGAASYRHGVTTERAKADAEVSAARKERIADYERQLRAAIQQQFEDGARMEDMLMRLGDVRASQLRLVSLIVPLTTTKRGAPNEQGQCDVAVLSDAFGLCWNAAIVGTDAAAAACEAASRDGIAAAGRGAVGVSAP
jgi:hypothetical protein